ncbi:rCG24573 [Rattus norvegicus]|uniref:RCG24573 n=1 Tax=Rattus norvegicus TaxID=10116 RepID=A6JBR3_RAT|nr:rCG24573 [Rattus norvegicus]
MKKSPSLTSAVKPCRPGCLSLEVTICSWHSQRLISPVNSTAHPSGRSPRCWWLTGSWMAHPADPTRLTSACMADARKLAATASLGLQLKKTGVVSAVGMARPAVW